MSKHFNVTRHSFVCRVKITLYNIWCLYFLGNGDVFGCESWIYQVHNKIGLTCFHFYWTQWHFPCALKQKKYFIIKCFARASVWIGTMTSAWIGISQIGAAIQISYSILVHVFNTQIKLSKTWINKPSHSANRCRSHSM